MVVYSVNVTVKMMTEVNELDDDHKSLHFVPVSCFGC